MGEWLSCQGKETDKRRMLSHFFFAEANALATTLVNFDGYFSPFGLAELAQIIHETLDELDVQIDDIYIKKHHYLHCGLRPADDQRLSQRRQ